MEHHTEHPHEHAATEPTQASVAADIHVTISDAARITGASRTRLYRAIESGRLERHVDGKISLQALRNAGFDIKEQQPSTTSPSDNLGYLLTCYTDMTRQLNESLEDQIDALQEQLRFLKDQLRLSQQREGQLMQMLQRQPAETTTASQRTNEASRSEPQDISGEASQATHGTPFNDQSADAMPSEAHPTWREVQPQSTPPGGFFGRWRS